MKTLFTTLFAFVLVFAFGQTSVRPIDLVQSAQVEGAAFSPVQLFQAAPGAVLAGEKAPKAYDVLDISQLAASITANGSGVTTGSWSTSG